MQEGSTRGVVFTATYRGEKDMMKHPSTVTWRGGHLTVEGCDCMKCDPAMRVSRWHGVAAVLVMLAIIGLAVADLWSR